MTAGGLTSELTRDGYAILPGFLGRDLVAAAVTALDRIVAAAELGAHRTGRDDEIYHRLTPLTDRDVYVQFERHAIEQVAIRKVSNLQRAEPFSGMVAPDGCITRVAESVLGPAPIALHVIAQLKPAHVGSAKAWHQDAAYFSALPVSEVLAVWIALDRADEGNGCLHVARGAHHRPLRHTMDGECGINPSLIAPESVISLPAQPGDAVVLSGLAPHGSPPNPSDRPRRALVVQYRGGRSQIVSNAEFSRAFVDKDGQPAGCAAAAVRAGGDVIRHWS